VIEARDLPGVLRHLLDDPGRPRVTWYGPGGERVELSGKTLLNWVSKTANLLVAELDAEPGTTVGIDLPAHWRTVSWLLATWAAGAHAVVVPDVGVGGGETSSAPGLDVLVTTEPGRPDRASGAEHVVAVALPALATSFGSSLPEAVHDAAVEVRLQPDVFQPYQTPDPGDAAFTAAGLTTSHGDLVTAAREAAAAAGVQPGDRVLTGAGPELALGGWLGVLALDGSLVLHHDPAAAPESLDAQEAVSRRV
jgi:uncharacterized protein (TIGR03089 family)